MHNVLSRALAVASSALALIAAAPGAGAQDTVALTGRWTGTFEFIVLGKKTSLGPASVFNQSLRGVEGEPVRVGEGTIEVRIDNQVGKHFFGRWVVDGQSSELVCTMRDEKNFVCGGRRSNAVGTIGDEMLRMCWTASGANATSGCVDLTRPG